MNIPKRIQSVPSWLVLPLAGYTTYQLGLQVVEYAERHRAWHMAKQYAQEAEKPVLQIGMRLHWFDPSDCDTILDIRPEVLAVEGGVQGDVRDMHMFADRQFAACICSHVLEHLQTPEDVALAVKECTRVADYAILLFPSLNSYVGAMRDDHFLWLMAVDGGIWTWKIGEPAESGMFVPVTGVNNNG